MAQDFCQQLKQCQKKLLPIIDKPIIQYAVEEAIAAGCDTLIFITGRNKRAIEDHFDANLELEAALISKGKQIEAEKLRNLVPSSVDCVFIRQAEQLGLGHAVLCAEKMIKNEPFAVLLADDFLLSHKNVTAELGQAFSSSGKSQLLVCPVDPQTVPKYGIIKEGTSLNSVSELIEKPSIEKAPSNLASIGRYLLTPEIFPVLKKIPKGHGDEIQLADAINIVASKEMLRKFYSKVKGLTVAR